MDMIVAIAGWTGTVLILWAFALVSFKRISSDSRLFQWMNLAGALTLGFSVYQAKAWPALALEVVWGLIALVALIRNK